MVECIAINRDRLGLVLFHALWGKASRNRLPLPLPNVIAQTAHPLEPASFSDCPRVTLPLKTSSIPLKSHRGACRSLITVALNPSIKSGRGCGNGMSKSAIARVRTFSSKR
jgi:hypothetical protein